MSNVAELDPRLAQFEGDAVVLAMGGQLLQYYDQIVAFNDQYVVEDEPEGEFNTTHKQVAWTKQLANEPSEDVPKEKVTAANKLVKEIDNLQSKLTQARQAAANFCADELNISRAVAKPEIPPAEKERLQREVRAPAVELARSAKQLADGIAAMDSAKSQAILAWLEEYGAIPQIGRKGSLSVTSSDSQAPRYRVDVAAYDSEGNTLWKEKGFTKAAAKKGTPNAAQFREAYENNGKQKTEFVHEGTTFVLTPRVSGNSS